MLALQKRVLVVSCCSAGLSACWFMSVSMFLGLGFLRGLYFWSISAMSSSSMPVDFCYVCFVSAVNFSCRSPMYVGVSVRSFSYSLPQVSMVVC